MDDELGTCCSVKACLQSDSTDVYYVTSMLEALDNFSKQNYCLAIISNQLSKVDSKEIIHAIHLIKHIPIIVFSDPLPPDEKIKILQTGADIIIEKPFNMDMCVTQIESLIQLYSIAGVSHRQEERIVFGTSMTLIIIPNYRLACSNGEPLSLTRKEFDLLLHFARHPYQVFSKEQLYLRIWGDSFDAVENETVRVHVQTLRKKLGDEGKRLIRNVWGVGYKFVPPTE